MRLIRAYRPMLLTAGLLSWQSVAGAQSYSPDDGGRAPLVRFPLDERVRDLVG